MGNWERRCDESIMHSSYEWMAGLRTIFQDDDDKLCSTQKTCVIDICKSKSVRKGMGVKKAGVQTNIFLFPLCFLPEIVGSYNGNLPK